MPSITNAAAQAAANAIVDLIDVGTTNPGGTLRIYDGTPPTTITDALSGNNVLAEVVFQDPAFGPASDANPGAVSALLGVPLSDNSINATGTASFGRLFDRDDTGVIQVSVSATGGGGELQLNSTALQSGATFTVTALTFTMPES